MEELKKVKRIMAREFPGSPHEVLLVLDATTGQNAVNQAKMFNEAIGVTGLVLTKLDGTAKGGIALAIAAELQIPVKLIGVGEAVEDLRPFDADDFARALVGLDTPQRPGAPGPAPRQPPRAGNRRVGRLGGR